MREIKFRIWNKEKEIMENGLGVFVAFSGIVFRNTRKDAGEEDNLISDKNIIPLQYTGLKDKNGKEIYEGDILEETGCVYSINWDENEYLGEQVIQDGYFIKKEDRLFITLTDLQDCEVIGNIYENPELVEKKND